MLAARKTDRVETLQQSLAEAVANSLSQSDPVGGFRSNLRRDTDAVPEGGDSEIFQDGRLHRDERVPQMLLLCPNNVARRKDGGW